MSGKCSVLGRFLTIAMLAGFGLLLAGAISGIAVAADTVTYLYLTGNGQGIQVYDATDGTFVKTISGSGTSAAIAARGDGKVVYVAEGDFLKAIDTAGDTALNSVSYPGASSHITAMAVGSDNNLYVADSYQRSVNVYGPDLALVLSIPSNPGISDPQQDGYLPAYLAISPSGDRLYVGCAYGKAGDSSALGSNDYSLLIFDAATGERQSTLGLHAADSAGSAAPEKYRLASMEISPSGAYLWLGVYRSDSAGQPLGGTSQLLVISLPVTDSFSSQGLFVPPVPADLVFSPDGGMVYALAAGSGEGGIVSYDATGFQVARLYPVTSVNMRHAAISPDGSRLYVSTDKGFSILETGSGNVRDISTPSPVNELALVRKTGTPTPVPATPTPVVLTATPDALVTATPVPTATPAVTSGGATQVPASPTPTLVPLPSQEFSGGFSCLTLPAMGFGAVLTLAFLGRRRQP